MTFVREVYQRLRKEFGFVETPLQYKKPYQLAIAVILSAQCTDDQVNRVTPKLFKRFRTPKALAECSLKELESLIFSTGFYRNKAKNIQAFCRMLVEEYEGRIPEEMELLTRMPGVGRKTANVILQELYQQDSGVVVDTHVARISQVLGLTEAKDAYKIEKDLMKKVPVSYWRDWSLFMIFLGRKYCTARKRYCAKCPLSMICPSAIAS